MMWPFKSPETDVDAIKAKIAAIDTEIAAANVALDQVALQAVLAGDDAADEATAKLDELTRRRDLLLRALVAAEMAQHQAQADAKLKDLAARRRACSQHCGRLTRLSRAVADDLAHLIADYRALTEAAGALVATLPAHLRCPNEPWHSLLSAEELRAMILLDAYRQDRDGSPQLFSRPGTAMEHEDRRTGALPTLPDRIAQMSARVRAHFEGAPAEQPIAHSPQPTPAVERDGEVIDLRGEDLGLEKVKEETETEEVINA